jgi:hypothetical protein
MGRPPVQQGQDDWPQGGARIGQLVFEVMLAGDPPHHAGREQFGGLFHTEDFIEGREASVWATAALAAPARRC